MWKRQWNTLNKFWVWGCKRVWIVYFMNLFHPKKSSTNASFSSSCFLSASYCFLIRVVCFLISFSFYFISASDSNRYSTYSTFFSSIYGTSLFTLTISGSLRICRDLSGYPPLSCFSGIIWAIPTSGGFSYPSGTIFPFFYSSSGGK